MVYTSISGYYDKDNEFNIKEIYVSGGNDLYILKKSESYTPYQYRGNVKELYDSLKNSVYPLFAMSDVRQYDDDDPKALATFFMKKIQELESKKSSSDRILFDVLSGFGEELE